MTERPLLQLLRNRNFMLMWWAGLVSWVGNYMLFIALPVYVYNQTGSTLATSFSVIANVLPNIVVGQLAGVLVDRWDYRRTLVFTNFALVGMTLLFLTVSAVLRGGWSFLLRFYNRRLGSLSVQQKMHFCRRS